MSRQARVAARGRSLLAGVLAAAVALAVFALPATAFGAQVLMFQQRAPLPTRLSAFAAVCYNNKIYTFGGVDGSNVQTSAINVYDPNVNSWTANIGSLDTARSTMAYDVNPITGIAYLVGGLANGMASTNVTASVIAVDLKTTPPTVTRVGSIDTARYGARGRYLSGKFYIVGGRDSAMVPLSTIEGFDVTSNSPLHTVATFPSGRYYTGTFLASGLHGLGLAGGRLVSNSQDTSECYVLDPSNPPSNLTRLADLPYPRTTQQFVLLGNGVQYDCTERQGDVFSYSPAQSPNFQVAGSYPPPHRPIVVNVQWGDQGMFIMGGADANTGLTYADNCLGLPVQVNSLGVANVPNNGGVVPIDAGGNTVVCVFPAGSTVGQVMASQMGNTPPGSIPPAFVGKSVDSAAIWDVSTSSDYTGAVTITLPYRGTTTPVVQHWNGASWDNITDVTWNQFHSVTFTATSMSPFAVAASASTSASVPASSGWSLALLALLGVGVAAAIGLKKTRTDAAA